MWHSQQSYLLRTRWRIGVPGAEMWHSQQSYLLHSMNPTWILTMPGFGGTANLKSPPFTLTLTLTIPPRLRRGGCQCTHHVWDTTQESNMDYRCIISEKL